MPRWEEGGSPSEGKRRGGFQAWLRPVLLRSSLQEGTEQTVVSGCWGLTAEHVALRGAGGIPHDQPLPCPVPWEGHLCHLPRDRGQVTEVTLACHPVAGCAVATRVATVVSVCPPNPEFFSP